MLQFGLRLGERPRQMVTTTPRPIPLVQRLLGRPAVTVDAGCDRATMPAHLAPAFLQAVRARYDGTRLGRQELDGELIEDRADALWSRDLIEAAASAGAGAAAHRRGGRPAGERAANLGRLRHRRGRARRRRAA